MAFEDLIIDVPGLNYKLEVTCFSADYDNGTITTVSPAFHVYDYPETGLLRKSATMFSFKGAYKLIDDLIESFDSSMGTLVCTGCPAKVTASRKKRGAETFSLGKVYYPWCFDDQGNATGC